MLDPTDSRAGARIRDLPIPLRSAVLNDGAIATQLVDGSFAVNQHYTVSGTVTYYTGSGPVAGTILALVGPPDYSATANASGQYSLAEVHAGAYTLTPSKEDDVQGITAYDASLVLRASAGLLTLSANQILAADVNRNGQVTPMDAVYILEKSVGLLTGHFPGAGKYWDYAPRRGTSPPALQRESA